MEKPTAGERDEKVERVKREEERRMKVTESVVAPQRLLWKQGKYFVSPGSCELENLEKVGHLTLKQRTYLIQNCTEICGSKGQVLQLC